MADQYTPEEISEIFEAYNNAIKSGTPVSAELARQMQDAVKATKGLAKAQEEFGKSLGKSALQLSNSLYKGEKGVGQFGDAIETAATALQTLILAIPGLGIAAKVATVAMGLFAKGINLAAKQGDALFKTYQDLGRAGATASDGITGVFRNMQNLGYGIEELDKMVQLVTQNSETLAKFSLTAADGTNAFAEGMARIQRDGQLRLLGKTTEDINSAGASFIRQQTALGRRQNDMQGNLGDRTRAYIIELDRLQRLTGTSADALQKQQEELMAEDAYNVYMEMLEEQGEAGRAQIEKIRAVTAMLPKEYQTLVAQSIGGNVEAQQKLLFLAPNLIKDLQDPIKSTADTTKTLNQDLRNFKGVFRENYLIDPTMREFGGRVKDINEMISQTSDIDARTKAAEKNATVLDGNTKRLSEAQIANMNTRDAMQSFIQLGIAPATVALNTLAQTADKLSGGLPGKTGGAAAGSAAPNRGSNFYQRELYGTGYKGYLEKMIQAESGGRNIGNLEGTSSAFGLAQITKGTFEGLVAKAGQGNPLYGKTFEDMKADTKLQMEAAQQLTDQNRQYLQKMGVSTTDAALYLAHFLGPNGAVRALTAGDSSPIDSVVSPAQLEANKVLRQMASVGDLKNWADQKMGGSGYQFGGIASGPTGGYSTTLHGTEAIVPLPNGRSIPVEVRNQDSSLLSAQLDKLDELVRIMQNQLSVSNKILQAAN